MRYYKDIVNLLRWVLWACLATQNQRTFVFICRQKNQLHRHDFVEILQIYANLLWVLWESLVAHTHNDSINLYKTSIFICIPKIYFIIHFFLEILHLKKSCNLIGRQHFGPLIENQNFARYGIGSEISTTILVSILDYFQEKIMTKFFKKSYFGAILSPFCTNLGNFPGKKGSVSF